MFTGSADHPWPDESTTRVTIVESTPTATTGPVVDLPDLDLTDLDRPDLDEIDRPRRSTTSTTRGWPRPRARVARTCSSASPASDPSGGSGASGPPEAVCDGCRVVVACRDRARAGRENGFWGGESEEERAAAGLSAPLDQPPLGAAGRRRAGRGVLIGAELRAARPRPAAPRRRRGLGATVGLGVIEFRGAARDADALASPTAA